MCSLPSIDSKQSAIFSGNWGEARAPWLFILWESIIWPIQYSFFLLLAFDNSFLLLQAKTVADNSSAKQNKTLHCHFFLNLYSKHDDEIVKSVWATMLGTFVLFIQPSWSVEYTLLTSYFLSCQCRTYPHVGGQLVVSFCPCSVC